MLANLQRGLNGPSGDAGAVSVLCSGVPENQPAHTVQRKAKWDRPKHCIVVGGLFPFLDSAQGPGRQLFVDG